MQQLYKNHCFYFFIQAVKTVTLLFFIAVLPASVYAQNYTPNTFTDPVITSVNNATGALNGGATISLRSALKAADNLGGTHTITLSTGTYTLDGSATYTLASTGIVSSRTIYIGNTAQNITINGNGPGNTIVSMAAAGRDRILSANYDGVVPNVITTINGVKFQNGYLTTDQYGGAALYAGPVGGNLETLAVSNCTFDNNICPGAAGNGGVGGAIYMFQATLTVDNCTFTNNKSIDGDAGAIFYILYNNQGNSGAVNITNSSFSGNTVQGNGGAIEIASQGAQPGGITFTTTINNNTFTNNTANGYGGAVALNNSAALSTLQVHYNRFVGNTANTNASTKLSSALHFVESVGSVDAINNWWGCNGNPVSASFTGPCDQAGGDVAGGGSLTANPWLQLKTTAANNPICNTAAGLGNTNLITTSFLNNSAGTAIPVANLTRLIGLPVTWGPAVLGTLSGQQLTIQASGTATATFTSNGTGGAASVNTEVDNVPTNDAVAKASFTVNTIPTVTTSPNFTSCVGGTATFTSTITGTPVPAINWRRGGVNLVNGVQGSGSTVSGATTNTLTITNVQPGDAAINYSVQAVNQCGTTTSADAGLIVNQVTGGTVGSDQTICSGGDPAAFTESVASAGTGALTYQWQSSTTSCAAGFGNIGGATAITYDPPSGLAATTFYRRVTTSTLNTVPCTANSNCITVTINNVTGGTVGSDQTICSGGDPAAFTQSVASTGSGALTYQWQSSTTSCAAGFSDIGGATATTYDVPAGLLVTTFYRRVTTSTLSGVPCTANSSCITVTVNSVTGGTVGSDQTICSGGDPAAFTESVPSTGTPPLAYKWQRSTTDCISGFSDIVPAATGTTYDAPAGLLVTTYYRRVTTGTRNGVPCTANSNCITVTINNVTAGTVGSDHTVCSGGDPAAFTESVASTGSGALTYTWQSSTTSCAAGFTNIVPAATGITYDPPAGLAVTTFYRRVTNSTLNAVNCTANSNCITVMVNNVTGGTVGSDQAICPGGDPAAFTQSVASTGSGGLSYTWQSSTTGCATGFANIVPAATGVTYDPPAGLAVTTYYRRVATSLLDGFPCTANSNCITVTVNPNNTITLTSAPGTNNQSVAVNTPITNITYGTTGATGATFAGLPAGVTGLFSGGNLVTISGSPTTTVGSPFNYTVTLTGGCGSITATGTITVASCGATLTSAAGTNAQLACINTPITNITYSTIGATGATFAGLPPGVNGSWVTNVITISGTPNTTVGSPFGYTITLTGGPCAGQTVTGTITVNALPVVSITGPNAICAACSAGPGTTIYTAALNGPAESPSNVSPGTGTATITINTATNTMRVQCTFSGLTGTTTASHIHSATAVANTGTAGVATTTPTFAGFPLGVTSGTYDNTLDMTLASSYNPAYITANGGTPASAFAALQAGLDANKAYFNIHTSTFGGGEIRGFLSTFCSSANSSTTLSPAAGGTWISSNPAVATVTNAGVVNGVSAGTATFTFTSSTTNCSATTPAVTVNPSNTVTVASSTPTVCINTPLTNITHTTTGATGIGTPLGLPAGVTAAWAANTITISGTPTVSGVFNYTIPLTGGCGGIAATGTITVSANNTITLTSAAGTNAQTVCINTAITNITYSTTGATGATFAGLPAGVTGVWAANVVTISGTPTASGTFNYTVTLTGGCSTVTALGSITVTANNTITLSSAAGTNAQTVCINTTITNITYNTTGATGATFAGLPAGVTGNWAANVVTISGSPTTTVGSPFNYTVTLTGGCGAVTATGSITVITSNTITLTSAAGTNAQTKCINTPITNITYATTGATGATFAGLPAGVTGSWAANVVTITGSPTTTVGSPFGYTVTLTGGCGTVTATGSITVTPANTITLTSAAGTDNQSVLINTPITNITYSTTGATGATFAGLPAGVTGNWAGNVVTISGTPTAAGTFNYTVTLTGGCGTITATGTITVFVCSITLTSAAGTNAQTVCNNTPITNITYSTTGATGATFSGLPAGVTGNWAANVATISGTPTAAGTFTYTVTLTGGGCGAFTATGSITVNPTPNAVATPSAQSICSSSAITAIALTGAVPGTVFNWTRDNTVAVTGIAASGAGNISGTLTNTTSVPVIVTFTITPTANTCNGPATTATVRVNPNAVVTITPPGPVTICTGGSATFTASSTCSVFGFSGLLLGSNSVPSNASTANGVFSGTYDAATSQLTLSLTFSNLNGGNANAAHIHSGAPGTNGPVIIPFAGFPAATSGTYTNTFTVPATQINNLLTGNTYINIHNAGFPGGEIRGWITNLTSGVYAFSGPIAGTQSVPANGSTASGNFAGTYNPATSQLNLNLNFNGLTGGNVTAAHIHNGAAGTNGPVIIPFGGFPAASSGTYSISSTLTATDAASLLAGNTYINIHNAVFPGGEIRGQIAAPAAICTPTTTYLWSPGGATTPSITVSTANTYSVTATDANGCTGTASVVLNVNPVATVNPVASQVVCNNSPTTTVTFSSPTPGGTIVYNWTNNTTSIGLAASGTGNIASFTATNTTNTPVVATITVTPAYTNGGVTCTGTPATFTITVNPTPTVNPVSSQVVCNGSPTVTVNFTSPNTGGTVTYNWSNNNTSIGLGASGTGDILSFTATNITNAPVTATITVTPTFTNGGTSCVGTPITFTITVNPTPNVNQPASQTVCANTATAPVTFSGTVAGTVFNWTNDNPAIGLAASGTGNIASFTALNATNAPIIATIVVTPSYTNGGSTCTGPSRTFTITVNPIPTVAPVNNKAYCTGATTQVIPFSGTAGGTVAGTVYNWTNSNTAIGLAASGTGDIAPFVTTNATNGPLVATITVTPTANGCVGTPITFTITVNPTPIVNPVAGQVLCNGSPTAVVNFTSPTTPAGALSFTWTNSAPSIGLAANGTGNIPSFIAVNTGFSPVTASITVTPVYNNAGITCTGTSQTFTIVVNPTPTVNQPANQVLCHGTPTAPVNFTGAVAGTVYTWNNTNTSIGLAASGTGNIASFTATNITNTTQVATIKVTPTFTNGGVSCSGTPVSFDITVNPVPSVNPVANQTVCAGATVTQAFSGPVAGTVYNWTNSNPAIGLAASGAGNLNFVSTNTTGGPLTGTITVTPGYTNGGGTCTGTPVTFTITVNPVPTVNAVLPQVLCNGSATAAVNFTGAVAGTVYSWTNSNTSIGLAASGTGNIASFTATNVTAVVQTATITVTPSFTNNATTCTGTPITFTITVNPTPAVNAIANQTVCAGQTTTAVTITGPVAGTVYNWTNNNTSIGLGASGSNTIPSFTAINTGSTPVTATITVTPTFTNAGISCTGTATTFTITVNPRANVNQPADQLVCNGSPTAAVNFTGTVAGTIYNWTNNNTAIGLAASGTGNIASFTATNTTAAPITATITVTPSSPSACAGVSVSFTITVNPTPSVNAIANQTVCAGAATAAVTISGPVANTVYTWANNNTTIGLGASGIGNIPSFTAVNATGAPITATITVTPNYTNGGITCTGAVRTFTITVNPLPNIVFINLPQRACLTDTIILLNATPAGGTWSGPGVIGNTFSAAAAGVGVHLLSYTITNPNGCSGTRTASIVVNDCIERHNVFQTAIRIWPNPNGGRFSIQFNSDKYKEFKVKIVDAQGREMAAYEFRNLVYGQIIPFNLSNLASGQYFLYVYNTQESGVFPIEIVR